MAGNDTKQPEKDPFLCDRCQQYGYCLEAAERNNASRNSQAKFTKEFYEDQPLEESEISKLVPLRTTIKDAKKSLGKKVQQAHDLFHQDEFEQSYYLYRDILATRNDCDEARIGLLAALYFLGQYEDAAAMAERNHELWYINFPTGRFISQCLKKGNEQVNTKVPSPGVSILQCLTT